MSGTIHGRLEMYSNTASSFNNLQEQFVNVYSFIDTWKTRIALQYGKGGTGTNFWNVANPFGTNAFAVFRFTTTAGWNFYLLVQGTWSNSEPFGNSPGNPGLSSGSPYTTVIGFAAAAALTSGGADSNPWVNAGGGTGNAGADTKASPVWAPPSNGKLYVLPRSNNLPRGYHANGTVSTNKENCAAGGLASVGGIRYHMFLDDDAFVFFSTIGTQYLLTYVGTYTPAPGLTVTRPIVMFSATNAQEWIATGMGAVGGGAQFEGGIITGNTDLPVGPVFIDRYNTAWNSATWNPNPQFATATHMEWQIPLLGFMSGGELPLGYLGRIDSPLLRFVYNWATHNLNLSPFWSRICLGWSVTTASSHWTTTWDGVTAPGTGTTRAGLNNY